MSRAFCCLCRCNLHTCISPPQLRFIWAKLNRPVFYLSSEGPEGLGWWWQYPIRPPWLFPKGLASGQRRAAAQKVSSSLLLLTQTVTSALTWWLQQRKNSSRVHLIAGMKTSPQVPEAMLCVFWGWVTGGVQAAVHGEAQATLSQDLLVFKLFTGHLTRLSGLCSYHNLLRGEATKRANSGSWAAGRTPRMTPPEPPLSRSPWGEDFNLSSCARSK